ncbi:MAG: hypothetical protein RH862_19400 [Leptospiraceae bacterium]
MSDQWREKENSAEVSASGRKRLIWAGLGIAAIFCICAILNLATAEFPFCVSSSWCFSSRESPFLVALFQTLSFVLLIAGLLLGTRWAVAMLVSPRAYLYFALFFSAIGISGTIIWFLTVPDNERLQYIHVPLIGAGLVILGILFLLYFPGGLRRPLRSSDSMEPEEAKK